MAIIPDKQDSTVLERKQQKLKPPSMYKVVLLNDDFTPMEFVVMVVEYFKKDRETATQIMLKVHREGRGFVGSIRGTSRRPRLSKSLPMRGRPGIRCSA